MEMMLLMGPTENKMAGKKTVIFFFETQLSFITSRTTKTRGN